MSQEGLAAWLFGERLLRARPCKVIVDLALSTFLFKPTLATTS